MKAPLSSLPALPLAAGISAGVLAEHAGIWQPATMGGVLLFLWLYHAGRHYASFFFLSVVAGCLCAISHRPAQMPAGLDDRAEHRFSGIVSHTDAGNSVIKYDIEIDSVDGRACRPFGCLLTVNSVSGECRPGCRVSFASKAQTLAPEAVPIPGMPDLNASARGRGLAMRAYAEPSAIAITSQPTGITKVLEDVRRTMFNAIVTSPVDASTASFLTAVILSDDRFVDIDTVDAYRATGVAHMLALSGMHVGILAMMASLLLVPLVHLSRRGYIWRGIFTLVLIWIYVAVVGAGASVSRAAVMLSCAIAADMLQRRHRGWNSVCLSVAILLAVKPGWLFSAGFLMSVSAVASIMALFEVLPANTGSRGWRQRVLIAVSVPVAAMMGTGVVGACFFGTLPLLFLPANIIAGMLFPIVLVCGVMAMCAQMIGIALVPVGWIADTAFGIMDRTIMWLGSLDARVDLDIPGYTAIPYSAMLCCLVWALRAKSRTALVWTAAMLASTAATFLACKPRIPDAEMYITGYKNNTVVIARECHTAYLRYFSPSDPRLGHGDAESAHEALHRYYDGYLGNRGLKGFTSMPDTVTDGAFSCKGQLMALGPALVAIVGTDVPVPQKRATYAIVTDTYHNHASRVAAIADTLLLGADLNGSRRKRLIRECGDTVPYIDLRYRNVSIKQ